MKGGPEYRFALQPGCSCLGKIVLVKIGMGDVNVLELEKQSGSVVHLGSGVRANIYIHMHSSFFFFFPSGKHNFPPLFGYLFVGKARSVVKK